MKTDTGLLLQICPHPVRFPHFLHIRIVSSRIFSRNSAHSGVGYPEGPQGRLRGVGVRAEFAGARIDARKWSRYRNSTALPRYTTTSTTAPSISLRLTIHMAPTQSSERKTLEETWPLSPRNDTQPVDIAAYTTCDQPPTSHTTVSTSQEGRCHIKYGSRGIVDLMSQ